MKTQSGWSETATGSATATATRAAQAGKQHIIYSVSASSGTTGSGDILILVKDGTTTIWQELLDSTKQSNGAWVFPRGLKVTPGAACSIVATKTGATVKANLHGITSG